MDRPLEQLELDRFPRPNQDADNIESRGSALMTESLPGIEAPEPVSTQACEPEDGPDCLPEEEQELLRSHSAGLSDIDGHGATVVHMPQFCTTSLLESWIPKANPDRKPKSLRERISDRDTAFIIHLSISSAVLVFNIVVTIWIITKFGMSNRGDIFQGNCHTAGNYNLWLHFVINFLSTLLLGSSNFCAHILAAPTREEVDKAHRGRDWLDIGVQSLRNLRKNRIQRNRRVAWFLLMGSSGLLHLIWNSAIFSAVPVSTYHGAMVTNNFLDSSDTWSGLQQSNVLRDNLGNLTRLETEDCIKSYGSQTAQAGLKDLIIVLANISTAGGHSLTSQPNSSLVWDFINIHKPTDWVFSSYWMCSADAKPGSWPEHWCDDIFLAPQASNWTLWINQNLWARVDYCLTAGFESLDDRCAVGYSAIVLIFVCLLNALKLGCIGYTYHLHKQSKKLTTSKTRGDPTEARKDGTHLVTLGDAIGSFLEFEDGQTKRLDFADRENFEGIDKWPSQLDQDQRRRKSRLWSNQKHRWFWAASRKRWAITISLCVFVLVVVGILLSIGIKQQIRYHVSVDIGSLQEQGLGDAHPYATALSGLFASMSQTGRFFAGAFFANMFQIIFSALYLLYNGLLTALLLAREWSEYLENRKPLRLSSPRGMQLSSYFLSMPFSFGIPLTAASGLLHWLISQSVFVIQTRAFSYELAQGTDVNVFRRERDLDVSQVGFSSIGIIYSMIAGGTMLAALIIMGYFCKYASLASVESETVTGGYSMPLASSCSAAISAACHRPSEDLEAHLLPVRWGMPDVTPGKFSFTTARDLSYPPPGK